MPELSPLLVVAALSLAGWAVAERLKVPASGFLGPLLAVGAAAILGMPQPVYPAWSVMLFQVFFGAFLGCQADKDTPKRVRALGLPVAFAGVWTVVSAFGVALLLVFLTRIDGTTSFLSAVPGGVAEMSAMSIAMGGNTPVVAALQSMRVIATMALIPIMARWMLPAGAQAAAETVAESALAEGGADLLDDAPRHPRLWGGNHTAGWLASLAVGLAGGLLFTYLNLPAGGILGSMAAVATGRVAGLGLSRPPQLLRLVALLGMGSYVGTSFSAQTLVQLRDIALPSVLVTAATVGSGLLLARILRDRTGMSSSMALLACAPAGVTQMAVIADELGGDVLVVTLFQLTRLMMCVFVLPLIYGLLA